MLQEVYYVGGHTVAIKLPKGFEAIVSYCLSDGYTIEIKAIKEKKKREKISHTKF